MRSGSQDSAEQGWNLGEEGNEILFRIQASWGHPLSYEDEMRNKRISSKRSPVELHFAFTTRICKAGHVSVNAIGEFRVKVTITGIGFNLYHLTSAKSKIRAWR